MIRPGLTFALTLMSLALSTLVSAQREDGLLKDYHPTPNAPLLPVRECTNSKPAENLSVFICKTAKVTWAGPLDFSVSDPNRTVMLEVGTKRIPIKLQTMPSYLDRVLEGDWNHDQRPDYAIKLAWGGNGIIGDGNVTVFALSNRNGHKLTAIDTLTFDKNALLNSKGNAQVLHVSLVSANARDGRNHNYFVYTPLEVRGDALVASKRRTWIQYTFKPNHTPATNLSKAEMARAWDSGISEMFVTLEP